MSFTGSSSACAAQAEAVERRQSAMHGRGLRTARHASQRDVGAEIETRFVKESAGRVAAWLQARQAADGHWRAPLEGDTILESEFILILAWAGRLDRPDVAGAARRILSLQLPNGGWAIHPGGPVDVSASVKAYLALKLTGQDASSPALVRATWAASRIAPNSDHFEAEA